MTKAEAHARRLGEAINLGKKISGANMLPALFCLAGIAVNHLVFRLGALASQIIRAMTIVFKF